MPSVASVLAVAVPAPESGAEAAALLPFVDGTTGGLSVAVLLVGLLAYLHVLKLRSDADPRVRRAVLVAVAPLSATFAGIVLYQSLRIVGIL